MLLLLLMTCLAATVSAQVKISGKVTDETGTPLPGITVTLKNSKVGANTTVDGLYSFTANVPAGNYVLAVTGVGFTSQEIPVTIGTANITQNVTMGVSVSKLDEIVVTGTSQGTTRRQLGS